MNNQSLDELVIIKKPSISIREAAVADNEQLIILTQLTPMTGLISLRVDRKPDFFSLLKKRGEHTVFVAEVNNQLVGSIAFAVQKFTINKIEQVVYYVCDFKVHPLYKRSRVAFLLLRAVNEKLKTLYAKWAFITIAFGNKEVLPGLEGRLGFPLFFSLTKFVVYQLLPKNMASSSINLLDGTLNTSIQRRRLYESFYKRYKCYPTLKQLDDCIHFSLIESAELKASISVFDPGKQKQNVVTNFPVHIKMALGVLRLLQKVSLVGNVPQKNKPINNLYIRHFGFEEGCEKDFIKLIRAVRHYAFARGYHFVSISVDENDVLINKMIKPLAAFKFVSEAFLANLDQATGDFAPSKDDIYYEDYSLV